MKTFRKIVVFNFVLLCMGLLLNNSCMKEVEESAGLSLNGLLAHQEQENTSQMPEIHYFTISPEVGHVGDWFLFSWETTGADRITIEPSITDMHLGPTGSVAGKVDYSTWYTLIAENAGQTATRRAWVQVSYPEGSSWRFPRADTSNSGYSPWWGPLTNAIKWTFPCSENSSVYNMPITLGLDASVYMGVSSNGDDHLIVLNPDGTEKFDRKGFFGEQVIDSSGVIYCTEVETEKLIAMDPDGTIKWELDMYPNLPDYYSVTRQIYIYQQEKLIVYDAIFNVGDPGIVFYIINKNGEIEHSISQQTLTPQSLTLNCDSSIVFASGGMFCINNRLEIIWSYGGSHYSPYLAFVGIPVTDQYCNIYVSFRQPIDGDYVHGIMALDGQGNEIWRVYLPAMSNQSLLAKSESALYVVIKENEVPYGVSLCAIHLHGWMMWKVPLKGYISRSEVVVDSAGRTYVTTSDYLYSFNHDGTIRWEVHYPGEVLRGLTLSMDGTLYVVGNTMLYAFGT